MGLISRIDDVPRTDPAPAGARRPWRFPLLAVVAWAVAACGTAGLYVRAAQFATWERAHAPGPPMPFIGKTRPTNGQADVLLNTSVAADVYLPTPATASPS